MAIEYGYRRPDGTENWLFRSDRSLAEEAAVLYSYTLVAREVSEPYVVSIRG